MRKQREVGRKKKITPMKRTADAFIDGVYQLGDETERWLVLPDIHVPDHDERSLNAVLKYAETMRWNGVLQLGDFLDLSFCSKWTVDNARAVEGHRFLKEYDEGNKVLDRIQAAVRKKNPDAHTVILEGNHDWRVENCINKTPMLEGLIEFDKNMRIEERNAMFWRYWSHRRPLIIGHAHFIHGEFLGIHHSKKTCDSFNRSVFYGHTHDSQSFTKSTYGGDIVQCQSLGTLSNMTPGYMGSRPSAWIQCFAQFFIRPDGNFNHVVTNIIDHEFTGLDGKTYKG